MNKQVPLLLFFTILLTGCAGITKLKKGEAYPLMYDQQPHVIAVLPPINNTTSADAKEYYLTTIAEPLNQLGYYVIPVEILAEVLANEGLTDTEVFRDASMHRFGETFGADAVLFTEINEWEKDYMVIASTLTISINAILKSTRTNEILWSYRGRIVADLSGDYSSGGIGGIIAGLIVTAINTAAADYVDYARLANANLLYSIPLGKYRENHLEDAEMEVIFPPGLEPANSSVAMDDELIPPVEPDTEPSS